MSAVNKMRLQANRIVKEEPSISVLSFWDELRRGLRSDLLEKDPSNFYSWKVIKTMFYSRTVEEPLKYLQKRFDWPKWKKAMEKASIGNSEPCSFFPKSNANIVHQTHHIAQLLDRTGCKIEELDEIVEFGGGYGCMCRLFFRFGFKGKYIIYDLPELLVLQEYFLGQTVGLQNVVFVHDSSMLERQISSNNLFVATWSLSETNFDLREKIFSVLDPPKYFLIAYRGVFKGINNIEYFAKFIRERLNYTWNDWKVPYLPGNERYLVGERK